MTNTTLAYRIPTRTLGRTGLLVSEIGFGAFGIGGTNPKTGVDYGPTDDDESIQSLELAIEMGCNFIDTADSYGLGRSERLIGQVIRGRRESIVVATKFGHFTEDDPALQIPNESNIRRWVEKSLERLGTSWIDLCQWHSGKLPVALEHRISDTLERLISEGLIRHAGLCVYGVDAIRAAASGQFGPVFSVIQESINPGTLIFEEAIAEAAERGMGVIAREPLGNGMLAGRKDLPGTVGPKHARATRSPRQTAIRETFAERLGQLFAEEPPTLAQQLIRYALQVPGVSTVIPGCRTRRQVAENFVAGEFGPLAPAKVEAVHAIYREIEQERGSIHPYAVGE